MPWYAWALIATYVVCSLLQVALIGKPREPYTPGVTALALVVNALCVWAIVTLGQAA